MALAVTGVLVGVRGPLSVRQLMVFHALQLECAMSMDSTVSSHLLRLTSLSWASKLVATVFLSLEYSALWKASYRVCHCEFQPGMYSVRKPLGMLCLAALASRLQKEL